MPLVPQAAVVARASGSESLCSVRPASAAGFAWRMQVRMSLQGRQHDEPEREPEHEPGRGVDARTPGDNPDAKRQSETSTTPAPLSVGGYRAPLARSGCARAHYGSLELGRVERWRRRTRRTHSFSLAAPRWRLRGARCHWSDAAWNTASHSALRLTRGVPAGARGCAGCGVGQVCASTRSGSGGASGPGMLAGQAAPAGPRARVRRSDIADAGGSAVALVDERGRA